MTLKSGKKFQMKGLLKMDNIKIRLERYRDFSWCTIYHNASSINDLRLALLRISNEFTIYTYGNNSARASIKFDKSLLNKELNIKVKDVQL